MNWRLVLWSGLGAAALVLAMGAAWIFTLPPAPAFAAAPPTAKEEAEATIAALKPPKRTRPLIAIVGVNDSSETTDYLMPYGILRRADVADVVALATQPGPVRLFPVLTIEPQATVADFDAQHPEGADYVIVPAMSRDDDPVALSWIKSQAAKGAIIVGVCAGAKVVGNAGLLDGRRATTHWYSLKELRGKHPDMQYVADRRLVVDRGVATTTGITASMPMSLILVEAIAGRDRAEAVGRDLGLTQWDARHDSGAFQFTRPFALTAIGNTLAFWNREQLGIELVARRRRSVAGACRGRLVADLSLKCGNLRPHRRSAADPQRPAHSAPTGRRELARGAASCLISARCRRQKHWTRPFTESRPATAPQRPTSSPCSSNIRGSAHRTEVAAPGQSPPIGSASTHHGELRTIAADASQVRVICKIRSGYRNTKRTGCRHLTILDSMDKERS